MFCRRRIILPQHPYSTCNNCGHPFIDHYGRPYWICGTRCGCKAFEKAPYLYEWIQSKIEAINCSAKDIFYISGGIINIKPGVYNFINPINITGGVAINGAGSGIWLGGTGSTIITNNVFGNAVEQRIDLYDWINDNIKQKTDKEAKR
jgi:hypothetical protein